MGGSIRFGFTMQSCILVPEWFLLPGLWKSDKDHITILTQSSVTSFIHFSLQETVLVREKSINLRNIIVRGQKGLEA